MLVTVSVVLWGLAAMRANYRHQTLKMRRSGGFHALRLTRLGRGKNLLFQASSGLSLVGLLVSNAALCSALFMFVCLMVSFGLLLKETWAACSATSRSRGSRSSA